jgi:Tfp pilus assembly protein PilF
LAQFVNLNKPGTDFAKVGLDHFTLASNELMVVHPDPMAYQEYYFEFKAAVDTSIDLSEFELEYNSRRAYHHYVNRQYSDALQALAVSYQINPENLQTKDLIFNISAEHMLADKDHERNLDSLNKYFLVFPFLKEDQKVINYYNYSQMRVIREYFHYGNLSNGLKNLDAFEAQLKDDGVNENVDRNYFAEMYLDLANYHLRKEQMNKATQSFKRGLELDPNSALLKDRYQMLFRVNKEINQQQESFNTIVRHSELSFEESFEKFFMACWTIDGQLTKDGKKVKYDESFKIMSYKNNKANYIIKGQTKKGKYSFRKKSKLLYLIPDINKDDFTIFKVNSINKSEMILMPFKNDKLTGEKIYMSGC